MAYENYTQVSWTDGSPITGERLQQMSTNIQQIKEATDSSPSSIKRLKSIDANSSQFTSFNSTNEIIALKDETSTGGNVDNRVSIGANRYYRVVLNFTGIQVLSKGAEDSYYRVTLHEGIHGSANTTIYTADFTPPIFALIDVGSNANATIANIALRGSSFQSRFGAGVHATVRTSDGAGFTNRSFFAAITRFQGQSATNAPAYIVPANPTNQLLQLYVEDAGGTA